MLQNRREHDCEHDLPGNITELDRQNAQQKQNPLPEYTLNCVHCRYVITSPQQRIEKAGKHLHHFTNPHGFQFYIGCFEQAPGVIGEGEYSDFWSWFSGYQWRIVVCRRCSLHLGWHFSAENEFYGLILERLIAATDSGRTH